MGEVIIGIISGTISGTGMGGGTILILCLSLFWGTQQHMAQATNLVFFLPTSISAIIISIKSKLIEWKIGIPIAISGMIGAAIRCNNIIKNGGESAKKIFWDIFGNNCDL